MAQPGIDSLETLFKSTLNEKDKLKIAYELSKKYMYSDTVQYFRYYNISIELAKKLDDKVYEGKLYLVNGNHFIDKNMLKALEYASKSYEIFSKTDSTEILSSIYSLFGGIYLYSGNYSKSFEYILSSLKINEQNNFLKKLAIDYNDLAMLYSFQQNYSKSLEYYFKALDLNNELGKKNWYCTNLLNISILYGYTDSLDLEYRYALEAFKMAGEVGEQTLLADVLLNLAHVEIKRGEMKTAAEYLDRVEDNYKEYGRTYYTGYLYLERGFLLRKMLNIPGATDYYKMALKLGEEGQYRDLVMNAGLELSRIYRSTGNFREAFNYYEIYHNTYDSISSVEKTKRITELELQYNFDKQMEIKRIEEEEKNRTLKLQRRIIVFSFVALFLAVCLIVLIIVIFRATKRANILLEKKNSQIHEQNIAIAKSSEELIEQRDQLKLLSVTKDKIYSIIAHDLRNPFNVLLGFTNLLSQQWNNLDEDSKKTYIVELNNAAADSFELLQNLLEWARSHSGGLKIKPELIELGGVVNAIVTTFKSHANSKGITLLNQVDPDLKIFCDGNLISTVLRNLVSNAIKFTQDNGQVIISSKLSENSVSIIVEDNGIGISEENIQNLFNMETHFSLKGTNNEKGTGLGLLICKEFIEKTDGTLSVESKLGAGSRFIITLPSK